jgi:hypothetical protein
VPAPLLLLHTRCWLIEIKLIRLCHAPEREKAALLLSAPRRQPQFLINCEKLLHAAAARGF